MGWVSCQEDSDESKDDFINSWGLPLEAQSNKESKDEQTKILNVNDLGNKLDELEKRLSRTKIQLDREIEARRIEQELRIEEQASRVEFEEDVKLEKEQSKQLRGLLQKVEKQLREYQAKFQQLDKQNKNLKELLKSERRIRIELEKKEKARTDLGRKLERAADDRYNDQMQRGGLNSTSIIETNSTSFDEEEQYREFKRLLG